MKSEQEGAMIGIAGLVAIIILGILMVGGLWVVFYLMLFPISLLLVFSHYFYGDLEIELS